MPDRSSSPPSSSLLPDSSRRSGVRERHSWPRMSSSSLPSSISVLLVALAALCLSATAAAQPVTSSYHGRSVRSVAHSGGGGVIARECYHDGGGGGDGAGELRRHLSRRQQLPGNNDRLSGAAPGTSVALIILYSITGIVTALFLMIIITGAVRAHRHPERYGPRAIPRFGRPRQSRATGLARAVLDTIPIVRFGATTPEPVVAKPAELELQDGTSVPATPTCTSAPHPSPPHIGGAAAAVPREEIDSTGAAETSGTKSGTATPSPLLPPSAPSSPAPPTDVPLASQNQCPVCMEDFEQGTEVRVLPCGHSYHPDCIDPWLLNVSGSCPLCRIDLHPEGEEAAAEAAANDELPPATPPLPHRSSSRLAHYLHAARGANADERMAALRQMREERARQNNTRRSRVPELGVSRLSRVFSSRMRSRSPPPSPPPPPPPPPPQSQTQTQTQLALPEGSS